MLKNEVLMKSSHKLKNERSKHIQVIEQPLTSLGLNFFINLIKLRYPKYILHSRSSLLPSYCTRLDIYSYLQQKLSFHLTNGNVISDGSPINPLIHNFDHIRGGQSHHYYLRKRIKYDKSSPRMVFWCALCINPNSAWILLSY